MTFKALNGRTKLFSYGLSFSFFYHLSIVFSRERVTKKLIDALKFCEKERLPEIGASKVSTRILLFVLFFFSFFSFSLDNEEWRETKSQS